MKKHENAAEIGGEMEVNMKKKFLSTFIALTMAASLVGCSNNSTQEGNNTIEVSEGTGESTQSTGELTKISLGTSPWPTNMFFYLAKEKGIFEANGVDVTIQDFASTTESTNAFAGGQIDFCTFASSETISPFSQGVEFSVVLETDKSNGCEGLVATSDIQSVKDLKGKTVATQLYSVDHMFLLMLLEDNGMTEDDINVVDMSIQEAGSAFVAGQVDAACIWNPYFSQAINAGGTELFSSADNPNLITDVLVASKSLCEENPQAVTAVVQSFFEAVDYWRENPEEANEYMGTQLGVGAEEFASEMEGLLIPKVQDVITAFTQADGYEYWGYTQNTVRDFMHELGVLDTNEFNCGDMIDDSFVKSLVE